MSTAHAFRKVPLADPGATLRDLPAGEALDRLLARLSGLGPAPYSTDETAAFRLLTPYLSRDWEVAITMLRPCPVACCVRLYVAGSRGLVWSAEAETLPLAVCRAVLLAKRYEAKG